MIFPLFLQKFKFEYIIVFIIRDSEIPMIPLGLKETKEIDFREPLLDFVSEHYSEEGADFEDAVAELMDVRQAMRTPARDATGEGIHFPSKKNRTCFTFEIPEPK